MATTRTPTGQDLICLVCHKQAQDIDHVVNRGSGGSKERDVPENKVPLCRECHELKTLGRIVTWVNTGDLGDGVRHFYEWRKADSELVITVPVEVSQRYKCLIERSLKEESDGTTEDGPANGAVLSGGSSGRRHHARPDISPGATSQSSHPRGLTHEQRVDIARAIKDTEWNRQWIAGDTANQWRKELGEEAEQYLSDFGYVELSLANIMRVCEKIPPPFRNAALRFSHHVVVADLKREDQVLRLKECEVEKWSVAEFRRQVKGGRPRVKRYSPGEIHDLADEYPFGPARNDIRDFADWLGQRDGNDGLAD